MEVDSLGKKGNKGGGKGVVKGINTKVARVTKQKNTPDLANTGKRLTSNHTEWDCWFNPKNKSPEAI